MRPVTCLLHALSVVAVAASLSAAQAPYLGVLAQEEFASAGPGVAVLATLDRGPAWRAGVEAGDRILSVGDTPVADRQELAEALAEHATGDRVALVLWRDGERWCTSVCLGRRPDESVTPGDPEEITASAPAVLAAQEQADPPGWLGIEVEEARVGRLVITRVQEGSPADRAGLQEQDQLTRAEGVRLEDLDSLSAVLDPLSAGEVVAIEFLRRGDRLGTKARLGVAPEWSQAVHAVSVEREAKTGETRAEAGDAGQAGSTPTRDPPPQDPPPTPVVPPPPVPVTAARAEAAPVELDQRVAQLEAVVAELQAALAQRDAELAALRTERQSLQVRLDCQDQVLQQILKALKDLDQALAQGP